MSWAKLDDRYTFNSKVLAVGNDGAGVHSRLISWCAGQLSDGFVLDAIALAVAGSGGRELLDRLVAARLLDPAEGGYRVHNYLKYQSSATDVRSAREADRLRKASARTSERNPPGHPNGIHTGVQAPESESESESDPSPKPKKKDRPASPAFDFAAVYEIYPRKEGKSKGLEQCRKQIQTQGQYDQLVTATKRYAAKVRAENTETRFIKLFSTFLGCWPDYLATDSAQCGAHKSAEETDREIAARRPLEVVSLTPEVREQLRAHHGKALL